MTVPADALRIAYPIRHTLSVVVRLGERLAKARKGMRRVLAMTSLATFQHLAVIEQRQVAILCQGRVRKTLGMAVKTRIERGEIGGQHTLQLMELCRRKFLLHDIAVTHLPGIVRDPLPFAGR